MDDSGPVPIVGVEFRSPVDPGLPVDTHPRSRVLARMPRAELDGPQRPGFHLMHFATDGRIVHQVDFHDVTVTPGDLLHVHPGQVQRWYAGGSGEASLVVFRPELLTADPWLAGDPPDLRRPSDTAWVDIQAALAGLAEEQSRFQTGTGNVAAMVALLRLLLARVEHGTTPAPRADPRLDAPYRAFRRALETHLGRLNHVEQYAAVCGYSSRTISRACLAACGRTAKQVLDARVILEAKRLLVHTGRPAASIGATLGYPDPSAFSRAFRRVAGQTPDQFRGGYPARDRPIP